MRTAQKILDDASKRYNAATRGYGMLARHDVIDFLEQLSPDLDKRTELNAFLDEMTFLQPADRDKLMQDLDSYGI